MSERETWYVLIDGGYGDPREISAGADGVLRHKDGRAVAYAPHGPRSRGVDPDAERAKVKPGREMTADDDQSSVDDRELKPATSGKGYRTRGTKAY